MKKTNKEVSYHTLKYICDLAKVLKPKEFMTISEWAEKNMILPQGSNEPGRFRVSNMPFQKEVLDAIADPGVTDVTVMSSAQVGKTTIILCGIGYYIEYDPSTQLMVLSTLNLSKIFSKTKLAAMLEDVKVLREKVGSAKSRDGDNTQLYKKYPGGYMILAGANSPDSLSSMSVRVVWMDEVDRFPDSAGDEGNPVMLAEKRSASFWNAKHIRTSTPTRAGDSKIETEYQKGTMEEWMVKCPCCGEWQPYEFDRIEFKTVTMKCAGCGEKIGEQDWKEAEHRWIAKHPERKSHRSFHLNELASPFSDWKKIIEKYKDAYQKMKKFHDPNDMISFVNTVLGKTWDDTDVEEDTVDAETLKSRAEVYRADIPYGVIVLTAAVDVQKDRFEIEIRGWAREYQSWGIYKTEIYGNLDKTEVWEELEDYISQSFSFEDGTRLGVAATTIDTGGDHTNAVYKWVKKMHLKKKPVYGIKGYSGTEGIPLLHKETTVKIREKMANGKEVVVDETKIHILGVDAGKEDIVNRLKIDKPGEGFCHFPANAGRGYTNEYYEGLLSEKKIYKKSRGVYKYVWVKKSGVRNEPLDLFNYGLAALELRRPAWNVLEEKLSRGINYMEKRKVRKAAPRRRTVSEGVSWE